MTGWIPTQALRQRLQQDTDLIFLFVTSRSGSTLIQTLLDDHPQILQHPNFFKYFDFIAAMPDLFEGTAQAAASAFAAYPAHSRLFDTNECHVYGGRIGLEMNDRVTISKTAFVDACAQALPERGFDAHDLLYAVQLAFAWLLGRPVDQAKICLQHIHHGDWLWPDTLLETYNLSPMPREAGINILPPDKIIISTRNPVETLGSLENLVAQGEGTADEKELHLGVYRRLYVQDVLRQRLSASGGIPTRVVDLKDLRTRTGETMRGLAEWLEIDPTYQGITTPTAFGLPWFGDRASKVSNKPQAQKPLIPLRWLYRDEAAILLMVGDLVSERPPGPFQRQLARLGMRYGKTRARPWTPSAEGRREADAADAAFFEKVMQTRR